MRIEAGQAGATVLDFVTGRFTYLTREQWELELAAGRLLVNGEPVAPEQILAAADQISYQIRATLCTLGLPGGGRQNLRPR